MRMLVGTMTTRRLACTALVLLGCSNNEDHTEVPAPAPAPEIAAPPSPRVRPPVTVHWSNVVRTDNCWFFSGPEGRDDQLVGDVRVETVEREGERIRVRIGTATFEGTYARGQLALGRSSDHDYNGAWSTTEVIRGQLTGRRLEARYRYEECEIATRTCPGRCTITGDLVFSRAL
ncbi:hypothetical protein BH11MYX3_BH11MYX3_47280 [soil metagenome]